MIAIKVYKPIHNIQFTIYRKEITRLTQENAMLKAYIQEQNEKAKVLRKSNPWHYFLYKNLRRSLIWQMKLSKTEIYFSTN